MAKSILDFKKITGGKSGKSFKKVLARSDGRVLWSAGSTVTYVVDTGTSYTEEVDSGASCLSPKTFTPSKDGWTFVGWREDTTASGSVLSSKVMDSEPVTLYAVFKQTVTAKFVSYNSTQPVDGTRYYNYGNIENASVTVPTGATYGGWSWRGWGNNWVADAAADVVYANGSTVYGLSEDRTYYGLYQQTITEKFIDYDGSKNNEYPQYATTYYNSAGNTSYSNITVPNAAEWSGMAFQGWSYPNSNSFDVNVTAGQVLQSTADCTRYAIYAKTVYLYYDGNGASSGSVTTQSGTVRCNVVGNWSYPSFTLAGNGFTRTGYNFTAWNLGAVGASVTLSASATAYAQWSIKNPFTVYAANWASSDNVWTTTYDVITKESDFVTIDNPYWGVESTYDYTYGRGTIAVKNASNYKTVTINWKQRDWSDYCAAEVYMGASSPGSEDGSLYYNRNYTKWFDMSQTFELTNGAKTVYWTARAGSEDGENDGGVHIAITSVVLNA